MKVYLAGPEVFIPNARMVLDEKIELTRAYGFVPVCPGDLETPASLTGKARGLATSEINERLMLSADFIIANLTPFRGIAADVGTVYELGFMCGRGCPAYAFTNIAVGHYERVKDYYGGDLRTDELGAVRGPDGLELETYDMTDNLMLDGGIESRKGVVIRHAAAPDKLYSDLTGFRECLAVASKQLLGR
ncbi:MAG: nucleoside 2-deoxyribosyltransferase [Rhizobiales bacterium]|nr:nucleoside 2-deoxyribosyltransferase [Hyphomicrobiales bacterium]